MSTSVVASGFHDVYLRWDVSTPERVLARLNELPGQGTITAPGRKLFAERDRFGKWSHLLGRHQLVAWMIDSPTHGEIRRLEVQTHLGDEGEDDLCAVDDFMRRWEGLQRRMALYGVLPATDPRVMRVDVAVDVTLPGEVGWRMLEALKFARWPNGWYSEFQGPPPYTTVAVKHGSHTVARVYCRNSKVKNGGERWGKLRFETEQRFQWATAPEVTALESPEFAEVLWSRVFGMGKPSGRVTRLAREEQTVKLIERVRLGEIGYGQYERMAAFLDAERLNMADKVYSPETLRRRRREAKQLGLSVADVETVEFDEALDELLTVPRSAFAA